MKPKIITGLFLLILTSCASTSDIDLSKVNSACGQSCSQRYSECVSKFTFFPIMVQNECTDALRLCARHVLPDINTA